MILFIGLSSFIVVNTYKTSGGHPQQRVLQGRKLAQTQQRAVIPTPLLLRILQML